jgi:putative membrane protein
MNRVLSAAGLILAITVAFATTALAQRAAAPLPPAAFVRMASASDLFEIRSSRLALNRSADPRIRSFARRMVHDHTRTSRMLMRAVPPGLRATPRLNPRQAGMLRRLGALRGPAFDRAYARMQVSGHRQAVALFRRESSAPRPIGPLARSTLPLLREHLAMAIRL